MASDEISEMLARLLPYSMLADKERVTELQHRFAHAAPYPHVLIDDFFDEDILARVDAEFPDPERFGHQFNNVREVKRATRGDLELPPVSRALVHALNSGAFIGFLEAVTGISGLVADPHLTGGGLHALPRGGKLALHTDFNYNKKLRLDRRVNVLIYLNRDWPEAYGGHFEAWAPNGKAAVARYLPIFNRMVIFNTTDFTFHGNPDPVVCPPERVRRSIALYYYTNGRPAAEWAGVVQTTQFMNRPGESLLEADALHTRVLKALPKPVRVWLTRRLVLPRYQQH